MALAPFPIHSPSPVYQLAHKLRRTIGISWQSGSKLVLVAEDHSGNALVVHYQSCSALPLGAVLVDMLQCIT